MLRRLRHFENWEVWSSEQHDLGRVVDCYFDDDKWTIRYIVVRTGSWLMGRSVLLSPMSIERVDQDKRRFESRLSEVQIRDAPGVDHARPVSRRWEIAYNAYFSYPHYWTGPGAWGAADTPKDVQPLATAPPDDAAAGVDAMHLRSVRDVVGHHIHARDGEIGHVDDFLVDASSWTIRFVMIDTSNWIGGRTVLVVPEWCTRIDWERQIIEVDRTREAIKNSLHYESGAEMDPEFETRARLATLTK
jgi:hypothetical protein